MGKDANSSTEQMLDPGFGYFGVSLLLYDMVDVYLQLHRNDAP